jgi:O-antigen biosynthesis protein WbqV
MDEAVNLLLLAAAQPSSSTLWAPALPEAHRIVELAHFMAGVLAPGREIPIEFTGLRPGDKLRESLWEDAEVARTSANGDLLSIQSSRPAPVPFQRGLAALRTALAERSLCTAIDQLCALVPGYSPSQFVLALARRAGEGVRV